MGRSVMFGASLATAANSYSTQILFQTRFCMLPGSRFERSQRKPWSGTFGVYEEACSLPQNPGGWGGWVE